MRMTRMQIRTAAAGSAIVLAAGLLAGCGSDDDAVDDVGAPPVSEASPNTGAEDEAAERSAAALTPVEYSDPFTGAREAAGHMRMTALALAGGFAEAGDIEGADTPAAELRANLTYLLSEHTYLAGLGIYTALTTSPTDPRTEAALAALDENSVALADAVGSVAGEEIRTQFLEAWRAHINDFVAYATAEDQAGEQAAIENLEAYQESAGALISEATGGAITAEAVQTTLAEHVETVLATIDAFKAGEANAFDEFYAAGQHMPETAAALAAAFAEAGTIEGDTDAAGSELRAGLTGLLTGHVYLTGGAVAAAYTQEGGTDSELFTAAAETLSQNTADLTAIVAEAAPDSEEAFQQAWAAHIDDFVAYAQAAAAGDQEAKEQELSDLAAYTTSAGALFEEATGGAITTDAVAQSLSTHVEQVAGTVDALAAAFVTAEGATAGTTEGTTESPMPSMPSMEMG